MTSILLRCCSTGNRRLARKRLYTFSTSTIASSTSEPIAIAKPPKLMVLIVSPNALRVSSDTITDKGMAVSEMIVVRVFIKKKKSTITTKIAPSKRALCTLFIELLIKCDCLKILVDTFTSAGKFFCSSASASSIFLVSSIVPVLGCFLTVISTAGCASTEAIPNLGALSEIITSATSDSTTGLPSIRFTTAKPISSVSVVVMSPRTMYSLPYSYMIPPLALLFILRDAANTSSSVTP